MRTIKKQISVKIALVLILCMVTSLLAVQTIKAVDIPTYTYIAANANPTGLGQETLITVWLDKYPPSIATPEGRVPLALWDFTVTIKDPNGNTQTKEITTDLIGAEQIYFTPTMTGTYTFTATFQENTETANTYLSSTSSPFELVVQEDPLETWPAAALPTEYWQRPIYGENREWASLTGNWLMRGFDSTRGEYTSSGAFNPYTTAPNTAHIMWNKQLSFGGVVGGEFTPLDFYSRLQYEAHFVPSIIIAGRLYYNLPLGNTPFGGGFVCVDLRTGEQLWHADGTIWVGQLLHFESVNQHGISAYLWDFGVRGSSVPAVPAYTMYDAFSGEKILTIPDAPTGGDHVYDENGNILIYFMGGSRPNRWLAMWNSTLCLNNGIPLPGGGFGSNDKDYWRPHSTDTFSWTDGIQWNVTVPDVGANPSIQRVDLASGIILARSVIGVSGNPDAVEVHVAYDAKTGQQKWVKNRTGDDATFGSMSFQNAALRDGVFTAYKQEKKQWYGYDANTGLKIWETDPLEDDWGVYAQSALNIAYGKFYAATYEGKVHAYDLETGEHLWEYYQGPSGLETHYTSWPYYWFLTVADGKIFATNGEHSPFSPMYRGVRLHVIDAETGEGLWNVSGWFQAGDPAISDGYYVGLNGYDLQIYCFGKGPSATEVSIQNDVLTHGSQVLIKGRVTDISPGTKEFTQTARFPHGVPAIADKDMTQWMEYLYEQHPLPTDAEGVEVWIDVIDANGNYRNIGTTTSDLSGFFSFEWEPDIPGKYTVVATFAGSESYWPSYAETAFTVGEPVVTPAPTPEPASMTDMYVTGFGIGIIVAIILVGLMLFLLLRKR